MILLQIIFLLITAAIPISMCLPWLQNKLVDRWVRKGKLAPFMDVEGK
jgi:hypothetical protein